MPNRLITLLCGLCLTFLMSVSAMAAEDYTYTVRIYAGAQGTIGGEEVVVYDNLSAASRITFDPAAVSLTNDKYYVRGLRESGSDEMVLSFPVTGDADYVVAYGILGNSVAYTVNYQDENGNTLAPSNTLYGNVDDQVVVAYLYIDGYVPQAYNIRVTLSENAAENTCTFVYSPLEDTLVVSATPTATATATAEAAPVEENPEDNTPNEDEDNITPTQAPATITNAPVPRAGTTEPEEVEGEDIGDNQVPLGLQKTIENAQEFARRLNDLPAAGKAGIVSGTALVLGGIWWLLFHKKKRKQA